MAPKGGRTQSETRRLAARQARWVQSSSNPWNSAELPGRDPLDGQSDQGNRGALQVLGLLGGADALILLVT